MHEPLSVGEHKQDLIDLNAEDVDDAESWLLSPGAKSSIQSSPHSPQLSHCSTTTPQPAVTGATNASSPATSCQNLSPAPAHRQHLATGTASARVSIDPAPCSPPELVACHSPRPAQQARASRIPRLSSIHGTAVPSPMHAAASTLVFSARASASAISTASTVTSPVRSGSRVPHVHSISKLPARDALIAGSSQNVSITQQALMASATFPKSNLNLDRQSSSTTASTASGSLGVNTSLPSPFSAHNKQHGSKPHPAAHGSSGIPRAMTMHTASSGNNPVAHAVSRAAHTAGGAIPTRPSQGATLASRSNQMSSSSMSSRQSSFRTSIPSLNSAGPAILNLAASTPMPLTATPAATPTAGAGNTTVADKKAVVSHTHAPQRQSSIPGSAVVQQPAAAAAGPIKRTSSHGASVHLPPPPMHHHELQKLRAASGRLAPSQGGDRKGPEHVDISRQGSNIPRAPLAGKASEADKDLQQGGISDCVSTASAAGRGVTHSSVIGDQQNNAIGITASGISAAGLRGQATGLASSMPESSSSASMTAASQPARPMHDEQLSRKVNAVVVAHAMVMQCVEQAVHIAHERAADACAADAAAAHASAGMSARQGSGKAAAPACCSIM